MRRGLILSALIVAALLPLDVFAQSSSVYPPVIRVGPQNGVDTDPSTALATENLVLNLQKAAQYSSGTMCTPGGSGAVQMTTPNGAVIDDSAGLFLIAPTSATLPNGWIGVVKNTLPDTISLCPPTTSSTFDALPVGNATTIAAYGVIHFFCVNSSQCYTF